MNQPLGIFFLSYFVFLIIFLSLGRRGIPWRDVFARWLQAAGESDAGAVSAEPVVARAVAVPVVPGLASPSDELGEGMGAGAQRGFFARYLTIFLWLLLLASLVLPSTQVQICVWTLLAFFAVQRGKQEQRRSLGFTGLAFYCLATIVLVFDFQKATLDENFVPFGNLHSLIYGFLIASLCWQAFQSRHWRWLPVQRQRSTSMLVSFLLHGTWALLLGYYLAAELQLSFDNWWVTSAIQQHALLVQYRGLLFNLIWLFYSPILAWIGLRAKVVALVFASWAVLIIAWLGLLTGGMESLALKELSPFFNAQLIPVLLSWLVLWIHTRWMRRRVWWRTTFPTFPAWAGAAAVLLLFQLLASEVTGASKPYLSFLEAWGLRADGLLCVVWSVATVILARIASHFSMRSLHGIGLWVLLVISLYGFSTTLVPVPNYVPFANGKFLFLIWLALICGAYLYQGGPFLRSSRPILSRILLGAGWGLGLAALFLELYASCLWLGASTLLANLAVSAGVCLVLGALFWAQRQHPLWRRGLWLAAGLLAAKVWFLDLAPLGWFAFRLAVVAALGVVYAYRQAPAWFQKQRARLQAYQERVEPKVKQGWEQGGRHTKSFLQASQQWLRPRWQRSVQQLRIALRRTWTWLRAQWASRVGKERGKK